MRRQVALMVSCVVVSLVAPILAPATFAATNQVVVSSVGFAPTLITVEAGDTFTLKNLEPQVHNFTTGGPQPPALDPHFKKHGALCDSSSNTQPRSCDEDLAALGTLTVSTHEAAEVGRYFFYCDIHPWMRGVIEVTSTV